MSIQSLYEDGQGHTVDEHRVEPVDLVVKELFVIETISSCTQFLKNKYPESPSNPATRPILDERNNDVAIKLCNKRCYTVYLMRRKLFF
jgi:hypothetical protein